MKHRLLFIMFVLLLPIIAFSSSASRPVGATHVYPAPLPQNDQPGSDHFVYADFEKKDNGRAVSNRGGMIQIYGGQESTPVSFKGLANASPGAPEIVRTKPDDPNHLVTFDYNLRGPNQWANVTLQVQGQPDKDGKHVADDVSVYKFLSVQLYVTGVDYLTIEFTSQGQGIKLDSGFPQASIRIMPNLNTYKIPLKKLVQPTWQENKIETKEVLKKLTAINISVGCSQCVAVHGTVVVDNLVFEK